MRLESGNSQCGFVLAPGAVGDADWLVVAGFPAAGNLTFRESGVANHFVMEKTTGNATFNGTIAAVHGDDWALEDYHAGAPVADGYVRVDINGTEIHLLAYVPP